MNILIQPVNSDDLEEVSEVLVDAASWLESNDQPLWNIENLTPEKLKEEYDLGVYYLGKEDDEPFGVFRLQMKDDWFWSEFDPEEATYIHRLSVKRKFAGKGYAHHLINAAIHETKKLKRKYLRLDCDAGRPKLIEFYKNAGFELHSMITSGGYDIARFEMKIDAKSSSEGR